MQRSFFHWTDLDENKVKMLEFDGVNYQIDECILVEVEEADNNMNNNINLQCICW